MTCEQCWNDAYFNARLKGTSQVEEYYKLLAERDCNETALS